MANYDFLNLSPPEFEELSRDLLQKHLGVFLESFTDGRDSGIDLQHSVDSGNNLVVQAKRYKNFNDLFSALEREVPKVRQLDPSRYILTTSTGLTPKNKKKILDLFAPYIRSSEDILGRNDLNNLLKLFPGVEQSTIKLWLSSEGILNRILHAGIHSRSYFEKEEIEETVARYVTNPSFDLALKIIKDRRYVIISGIPGIGKTTLARMLVYYYLRQGFEDFVFLSSSIDEGSDVFNENKRQIFLFDDFLGRSFNERRLKTNEEQNILKFIRKINRSENKILILTTREYILAQAKIIYEEFNDTSLELAKCVIDLDQYTRMIRAQILYNHLFFSEIPNEYLRAFLLTKGYMQVIDHGNYNPRIIETIVHRGIWKEIEPSDFTSKFLAFLENPESVWRHVYENQISDFSKFLLANLLTAGTPILFEDIHKMMSSFVRVYGTKYGLTFSELELNRSIRELENTFIRSVKDRNGKIAFDYQNPSIQDFLVYLFAGMPDLLEDLLSGAVFLNQLLGIFDFATPKINYGYGRTKILLSTSLTDLAVNRIIGDFDSLSTSTISRTTRKGDRSGQFSWYSSDNSEVDRFHAVSIEADLMKRGDISAFLVRRLSELFSSYKVGFSYKTARLLETFNGRLDVDFGKVLNSLWDGIHWLSYVDDFRRLEKLSPENFKSLVSDDQRFVEKVMNLAAEEIINADEDELSDILDTIQSLEMHLDIDMDEFLTQIQDRISAISPKDDDSFDWEKTAENSSDYEVVDEDEKIHALFHRFDGR